MQLKKLETVKVFWNEGQKGSRENTFSYYRNMHEAERAIADWARRHPGRSLGLIRAQPQVQYLDLDVKADADFFRRWAGVTTTEVPLAEELSTPQAAPAAPATPAAPAKAESWTPENAPGKREKLSPGMSMADAVWQVASKAPAQPAKAPEQPAQPAAEEPAPRRSKSVNRGKPGEVRLADMAPETKRLYWRCMDLRKRQRKAGLEPVSWKAFQVDHAAKAGA